MVPWISECILLSQTLKNLNCLHSVWIATVLKYCEYWWVTTLWKKFPSHRMHNCWENPKNLIYQIVFHRRLSWVSSDENDIISDRQENRKVKPLQLSLNPSSPTIISTIRVVDASSIIFAPHRQNINVILIFRSPREQKLRFRHLQLEFLLLMKNLNSIEKVSNFYLLIFWGNLIFIVRNAWRRTKIW